MSTRENGSPVVEDAAGGKPGDVEKSEHLNPTPASDRSI